VDGPVGPSEGSGSANRITQNTRTIMHRRAGLALGAALAFVAGVSAAACGQGDARESTDYAAPQASQTTPATQPVVTVYKSPT